MKKCIPLVLLLLAAFFTVSFNPYEEDKSPVFSATAEEYTYQNQGRVKVAVTAAEKLEQILEEWNYPEPRLAVSIVFPELTRYAKVKDNCELTADILAYGTFRDSHCYSIGMMQMKPVFAEEIERLVKKDRILASKYKMLAQISGSKSYGERIERIARLKNTESQLLYLTAFIDVCSAKYDLNDKDDDYRLKILSTAYNAGMNWSLGALEQIASNKGFPFGLGDSRSMWNYSDIACAYYKSSL